jgi:hypothetical protein
MTRYLVALIAILLPSAAAAQTEASVLAASDIWSEHPFQRPVEVEGREWLALVVADEGSRVEPAEVRWVASLFFEDSVFALAVAPAATPHLLLAEVPGVRLGPATTLVEYEASLTSDEPRLDMTLGDATYQLALRSTDPALCDAAVTLTQGGTTQMLYLPEGQAFDCDAPHFSVQWAGDLDGDGRLDLVTTFSPKYSWYPRRLYLSSSARPGELVGLLTTVADAKKVSKPLHGGLGCLSRPEVSK